MKKILVVDDEEKIRRLYVSMLLSEGFYAVAVSSAVDANEILKRDNIDLILLDIRMPDVSGDILYEVMQAFHKGVKVIVTSVYPLDEQKRVIEGAHGYHDKSQGTALLLEEINEVLNNNSYEKGINS